MNRSDKRQKSSSPALRILLAATLLLFAWRILAPAAADLLSARRPELAVAIDGSSARTHAALANALLQQDLPDAERAAALARRALEIDPLAPGALTLLAQAVEVSSRNAADAIWRLAARSSLRDLFAQANVLEEDIRRGQPEAVIDRVDILLRSNPAAWRALSPTLAPEITGPTYRDALVKRLMADPPWRKDMLAQLATSNQHTTALASIFAALKTGATPPTEEELRPFLLRLVADGRIEQAYIFWLGTLTDERKPAGDLLYNARFQFPVSNMPFDWSIEAIDGASTRLARLGAARILNVDFFGSRVPFRHVQQWLLLPPGDYVFSGLQRAQGLINDRGMRWRFYCADDPSGQLAATDLISGTRAWQEFNVSITVTPECAAQALVLELPARVALEQIISGSVSFMNLSLRADRKGLP